jgi:hypothetical protein
MRDPNDEVPAITQHEKQEEQHQQEGERGIERSEHHLTTQVRGIPEQGLSDRYEEARDLRRVEIECLGEPGDSSMDDRVVAKTIDEGSIDSPVAVLHAVDQGPSLLNEFRSEQQKR